MLQSKKLNNFFNECFKLNIQTTLDHDLLRYHYQLHGVSGNYNDFEEHVLKKYGGQGNGIFNEKDKAIFSVLKEIIVKPIYREFSILLNIGCASPGEILFGLLEKKRYKEYEALVEQAYSKTTVFTDLKNQIEEWEKESSFANKAIDKKMRDVNQFIFDHLLQEGPEGLDRSNILSFLQNFYKDNEEYFQNFRKFDGKDLEVASNFFNRRFANSLIGSADLIKANHQTLHLLGIVDEADFNKYIKRHTDDPYVSMNKSVRQVIYGNLNSKRIGSFQRCIMIRLYKLIKEQRSDLNVYIRSDDELVVVLSPDVSSNEYDEIGDLTYLALNKLKELHPKISLNIENYTLRYLSTDCGDMFYKRFDDKGFEIKGVDSKFHPQVFKLLSNKPIEDKDLMFEDKSTNRIVQFIKPIKLINKTT
jgi:hypothetical protein